MTADVAIIGAGGAGMFCALTAARRGRKVLLIDHSDRIGRKILISGGGRCNFTNLHATPDDYVGAHPDFCRSALAGFTPADFIALVEQHGIPYHEKKLGQLFCDGTADAIVTMLRKECNDAGVEWLTGTPVTAIGREAGGFRLTTAKGTRTAGALVVATGGPSVPKTGATGFGYAIAKQFGLTVVEPEPALVGLRWPDADRAAWADLTGVAIPDAQVKCGKASFREAVLLTHTGLSGPAILQASLYWHHGQPIEINLLPDVDVWARLTAVKGQDGSATLGEVLAERLPKRFAARFAEKLLPAGPVARLSEAALAAAARVVGGWSITPAITEGWGRAEVARGGVDTAELSSKTLEARNVPGLYFIGEVVDVTGRLGGFNFQWAWASAHAAGRAV